MKYFIFSILLIANQFSFCQLMSKRHVPGQPYVKYVISEDKGKDSITFYLSEFSPGSMLPLLVYVQGSGGRSVFSKENGFGIKPTSGHITWAYEAKDKAKLLLIEKPGVKYLDQVDDNSVFDKKFSLENWSNRIEQVIRFVIKSEKIDTSRVMIAGHSEGGLVAARVAKQTHKLISHVALLAGEGPSQLYSLYSLAETGIFFDAPDFTKRERIDSLTRIWKNILSDPYSTRKKFWGFTYLRWSSFLKTSVCEELETYTGRVFILQGNADKHVIPGSAKILYTTLLSKGKNVKLEMIEGADHSFTMNNNRKINGWQWVAEKTIAWFLEK